MYAVFWELGMSCLVTSQFPMIDRGEVWEASYQDLRTSGLVQLPAAAAAVPKIAAEIRRCTNLAMMVCELSTRSGDDGETKTLLGRPAVASSARTWIAL